MVKRIPCLDPELEVHLLTYPELFADRQIGREVRRAADTAQRSRSITQSERSRSLEHVGVDKVIVHQSEP